MNINGLKYFVTVAECGSFSKAAELLYIIQPALSRHIQRLEEELGAPLLNRSRKDGVTLTELGTSCLQDAKQIITFSARILSKAEACTDGKAGTVIIGYNGMEAPALSSLTDYMRKQYPNINVLLHHESIGDLPPCLLDGTVDIAFMHQGPDYQHGDSLQFLPLWNSRIKLLVPKQHPFSKRHSVRAEELKDEAIVGWPRSMFPEFYDAFHQLCQRHGFSPNTICEEETYAVFSYIGAGDGIGYTLSGTEHMFTPHSLCTVDIELEDGSYMPNWPLSLAWNKTNSNPCIPPVLDIAARYLKAIK